MILGINILTELVFNLKFSDHVIEADDKPFKGYTTPMVDLGTYAFKNLNTGTIKPKELFKNDYVEELYESGHVRTATKLLSLIFDDK